MNPFEIRNSLLHTAKDFMTQQYDAQIKVWELASKATEKFEAAAPSFPTMAEIIEHAIEMNKFISGTVETELINGAKKIGGITKVF